MPTVLNQETLDFFEKIKKETEKIVPINSGIVTNPDEKDFNFWNKAGSLTLSAGQGVVNAVEEQGDFLDENIISLGGFEFGDGDGKAEFKDFIPKYVTPKKWKEGGYSQDRNLPVFHKPEGLAENLTEGASRFITGFIGPSKFFKAAGLGGSIIKTGLRGMAAGAVTDLTVFDPAEGRLSDMLVEFDSKVLNNAVTQYLATDEDDTEMEGRLKNVLEGMLIGGPLEILFGVKAFKKAKKTKDVAEKEKIYKDAGEAIYDLKNPKIEKVPQQINIIADEKILKNIDDFKITSKKDYFSVSSKTKQLTKEYSGIPETKQEKYIIQTQYVKSLNAMAVSDVKISKEFRNLGAGKALYKIAIKNAFDKGLDFASDNSISESALRVYKSLEKEGFDVVYNKNVKTVKNAVNLDLERGKQIILKNNTDKMPIVIIKNKFKNLTKKSQKVKQAIFDGNEAINAKEAVKALRVGREEAKKETESFIKSILNTKSFKNADQVLKTIDDVSESFDDITVDYLQNDVLRNDTAEELAKLLSRDKSEVLKAITKDKEFSKQGTVRMLAAKQVLQEIAITLEEVSTKYLDEFGDDVKNWTKESQLEVGQLGGVLRDTVIALKDQIRGAARMTQAGRIKVAKSEGVVIDVEEIANIIKKFDGNAAVIAKNIKNKNPAEIINAVAKTKYQRSVEAATSLYINSLLSGVYTHAINMKSGLYEAFIRPIAQIGGGVVRADLRAIQLGFAQYQGMIMSMGDTMRAVGLSLKQGDAILDPLQRTQDNLQIIGGKATRPISGANLGFEGATGTAIDWVGKLVELPTRLLMTGDELLKQMNYRGRLLTNALDNTMERGLSITSKEGKANTDRIFKEGFDKNGKANIKDNPINADALEYARVSSYTNSLTNGSYLNFGSKIQKFLNEAPELRFIAPFIRTPTNLWRHFGNHFPLQMPGTRFMTKQNRDLWNSGDRRARAEVLGRQMIGIAATMYGLSLAMENIEDKDGNSYPKITGSGPADFRIKKQWLQLGWQDYSIAKKNEDGTITYLQYNRMDPRFFILGIIADLKENIININDQQKEDVFSAAALTVFKNITNKSYLRGISEALEIVASPTENKWSRFFGNLAGNMIPYSSLRNQGIPGITDPDQIAYETRSFVDKILNKLQLGEKYLEPKRDLLTGEPIEKTPNALYLNADGIASFSFWFQGPSLVGRKSDVKDNPVLLEISRLRIPLEEPSRVEYKTIDFTKIFGKVDKDKKIIKGDKQSAYDYWTENIGKVKDSAGDTLVEKLKKEINSKDYKFRQEGNATIDGGKELTLKLIYNGYKQLAYYDMLKKYPQAMDDIKSVLKKQGEMLGKSKDEDINDTRDLLPFDGDKDSFFFSLMSKAEAGEIDINSTIKEGKILENNSNKFKNVNIDFIKKQEGGDSLKGYIVKGFDKSGVTVGVGFDLGQYNAGELSDLPDSILNKLTPYLGLKGKDAKKRLNEIPLKITQKESDIINKVIKTKILTILKKDWEKSSSQIPFDELSTEQATAVANIAFQYGNAGILSFDFWDYATNNEWGKVYNELMDFKDKSDSVNERHKKTGKYLKGFLNNKK